MYTKTNWINNNVILLNSIHNKKQILKNENYKINIDDNELFLDINKYFSTNNNWKICDVILFKYSIIFIVIYLDIFLIKI